MNNKFQPSSLYIIGPNNEGNEIDKHQMNKMIRAKVIKVNMNNNMERKLLPHISSIYTH